MKFDRGNLGEAMKVLRDPAVNYNLIVFKHKMSDTSRILLFFNLNRLTTLYNFFQI
jgi:hypothetical protein